jgi:hypothetical protein
MVREISAGGVVIRKREGDWWMAAIDRTGEHEHARGVPARTGGAEQNRCWPCLRAGGSGREAARNRVREVYEETGVTADPITKLGDSKYVYTRTWGDGERVFKIVSFLPDALPLRPHQRHRRLRCELKWRVRAGCGWKMLRHCSLTRERNKWLGERWSMWRRMLKSSER